MYIITKNGRMMTHFSVNGAVNPFELKRIELESQLSTVKQTQENSNVTSGINLPITDENSLIEAEFTEDGVFSDHVPPPEDYVYPESNAVLFSDPVLPPEDYDYPSSNEVIFSDPVLPPEDTSSLGKTNIFTLGTVQANKTPASPVEQKDSPKDVVLSSENQTSAAFQGEISDQSSNTTILDQCSK